MQKPLGHRRSAAGTPGFTLLMLLLGLAVFGWGLHYKLSLYNPPTQSSTVQFAAKLLSQQERTLPEVQPQRQPEPLTGAEPMLLAVLFALLLTASCPVLTGVAPSRRPASRSSHQSGMSMALLRRPPPAGNFQL